MALELLEAMVDEVMFDQLRTKQQLGYSVGCRNRFTNGVSGISFGIESS